MIKNLIGHTKTVTKHRWLVFKLCLRAGIPWRGFVHDLSKFSPTEFWPSVKYYADGKYSPILKEKQKNGYSPVWLHHKGRNKHHLEYWMDFTSRNVVPVIPYKYIVETLCDEIAAGMVYSGKKWTPATQYNYYMKHQREKVIINPKTDNFMQAMFLEVKEKGIKEAINRKNLKEKYKKYCIDDKTKYVYKFEKGNWEKR